MPFMGFQPVSGKLFIKGGLAVAGFISFGGPETGTVWSQHFIAKHNIAFFVQTKFKLGICYDDTSCKRVFGTFFVKSNSVITKLGGIDLPFAGKSFF